MWLLILAIVMLAVSAPLSVYISLCYGQEKYERPMIFNRLERLFDLADIGLFVVGIVMIFIFASWIWGLAGIAIYWLLVVLVLRLIVSKKLF